MTIYRSETTHIPQSYNGRRFAEEYIERLKEQGAFKERKDTSQFVSIHAEYTFNIEEQKND